MPGRVIRKTLKTVFTAFLLGTQHEKNSVEKKLGNSFLVSLGKERSGIPHHSVADRCQGPAVVQSNLISFHA